MTPTLFTFLTLSFLFSFPIFSDEKILTFQDVVQRVLCESPELNIAEDEVGEQEGLKRQVKLWPNPILSYSVENILGNKDWKGWESAESRFEVGQFFELGGKRKYRANLVNFQLCAAQADYQAHRIAVLNKLYKAFMEVAGQQEMLVLVQEQAEMAEKVHNTVCDKVEAGKVSLIQQNKAEVAWSVAKIALERAKVDFEKSKERLSLLWGISCPDFDKVEGDFYELEEPRPLEQCISMCLDHPELMKSHFEYLRARQNLKLEKAGAIPDLTVVVGYKTLHRENLGGMIIGAAIPIPVFNHNQGNIQTARFESQRYQELHREVQLVLENRLSAAHRDLMRAYNEVDQISSTILKTATQSFKFAEEGYREGKFEYLDMLDSQRTLFEVKEQYIDALINYHRSKADIEYLNSQDE